MADQAVGKTNDALGNAAIKHQLASEHEERDGKE